jgi:hypothetical protein
VARLVELLAAGWAALLVAAGIRRGLRPRRWRRGPQRFERMRAALANAAGTTASPARWSVNSTEAEPSPAALRRPGAGSATTPMVMVAPSPGSDSGESRGGVMPGPGCPVEDEDALSAGGGGKVRPEATPVPALPVAPLGGVRG